MCLTICITLVPIDLREEGTPENREGAPPFLWAQPCQATSAALTLSKGYTYLLQGMLPSALKHKSLQLHLHGQESIYLHPSTQKVTCISLPRPLPRRCLRTTS